MNQRLDNETLRAAAKEEIYYLQEYRKQVAAITLLYFSQDIENLLTRMNDRIDELKESIGDK